MSTLCFPEFSPKQREAFDSKTKYTLFGGARGAGKSFLWQWLSISYAVKYAGIKIVIVRETHQELVLNYMEDMQQILAGVAEYQAGKERFLFPNGSVIQFQYYRNKSDSTKFQGLSIDVLFIDEVCNIEKDLIVGLTKTVRGVNGLPKRVYYSANPYGKSFSYIKRLFVDRNFGEFENPDDYSFISATIYDNVMWKKLDPDGFESYVRELKSQAPYMVRAELEGVWDNSAMQYFSMFKDEKHTYIGQKYFSKKAHFYRVVDYGLDRAVCLYVAKDYDGVAHVYDMISEPDLHINEFAQKMLERGKLYDFELNEYIMPQFLYTVLPHDMGQRSQESGRSKEMLFNEAGIEPTITLKRERKSVGWMNIVNLLQQEKILIESQKCERLIKHLLELQSNPQMKDEILDDNHELSHEPDALRYLAMAMLRSPDDDRAYIERLEFIKNSPLHTQDEVWEFMDEEEYDPDYVDEPYLW